MKWTLRKKILLGYGMALLLLLLVFAWAFSSLYRLGNASEAILSENYQSIQAADNMIGALERQDSGVLLYLLGHEAEGPRQFQQHQPAFMRWLTRAQDNITLEGEAAILARIDSTYTEYVSRFSEVLREPMPADAAYREVMLPAFRAVRSASEDLRAINQQHMLQASDAADAFARRAMWSLGLVGLAALALGFFFSLTLSNRLVQPIRSLQQASREVGQGNYGVQVETDAADELGALAAQFNEMAEKLRAYHELNVEKIMAEKRKSEAILRSIDDGLLLLSPELRIENLNPAAARALHLEGTAAGGRRLQDVIEDEDLQAYVHQTMQAGPPPRPSEDNVITTRREGQTFHYQYVATPMQEAGGAMQGVILLLRDVTKFKELDRLKSDFVATASHELKTPLTSINMSIGLLRESTESTFSETDAELLEAAQEDVERLRSLVHDLLDLSKMEAGRIELKREDVPVRLLFDKTRQTMQAQAEERSITLSCTGADGVPDVRADAEKITWVLTNLVGNALRYTDPGGRVQLQAEQVGSKVHVSVEDNGAGIPYEYQAKIFDKFVQVQEETHSEGSGLGLSISREMVHAHGGSIWVDSVPERGSTFTFTLPVAEGADEA